MKSEKREKKNENRKMKMSQNLQNFVRFQKFQLKNLVDFEKCCKTPIFLQKSEPIQPKTSNILPKFCQPTLSDVSASELGVHASLPSHRRLAEGLGFVALEPGGETQHELFTWAALIGAIDP